MLTSVPKTSQRTVSALQECHKLAVFSSTYPSNHGRGDFLKGFSMDGTIGFGKVRFPWEGVQVGN